MSSIFGNLGGGASKPTGGLFGNTGAASGSNNTQAAPGASLFGNAQPAATSAGSSGGLFSSLGGQQQQQQQQQQSNQQKPSLFGNTGASNNNTGAGAGAGAGAGTGTGLFGGLGGATNMNSQQPASDGNANQGMGASTSQNPQPGQGQAKPLFFDQLIERGKKRHGHEDISTIGQFGDLPSLQLGLGDIAKKVRGLGQAPTDSRAHYLLAASGVNTGTALRDLSSFTTDAAAKAPLNTSTVDPGYVDLDTFCDNLYKQQTKNFVDEALAQSIRDFDKYVEEQMDFNFEAQRQKVFEHFGLAKKSEDSEATFNGTATNAARGAFGRSSRRAPANDASFAGSNMARSVLGATGRQTTRQSLFNDVAERAPAGLQPAPEDRIQREKQDKYAAKVKDLNIRRLEERLYPVLSNFAEIEAQPSLEDTTPLVKAYKALGEIVGENPELESSSEPGAVGERKYAQAYLDESPNSPAGFDLRKRIIDGSRKFLEKSFLTHLETAISKNAKEAALGGVPDPISKVRAYIRLRAARKELGPDTFQLVEMNGDYPWVLVYHLLRAGLITEATKYVNDNLTAFRKFDRNFSLYLEQYAKSPDRRLSQDLQTRINNTYSQRTNAPDNSIDPYRLACYKVIGRCELSKRHLDKVDQSMEDFVWLLFALAREVNRMEETASESFGLEDVQNVIHEIGQRHFAPGTEGAASYGTYFYLQILTGQFESAVAGLYPNNYLSAVHFAIALNFYGLLRVNDFSSADDLLSYTTSQKPQISFGHLIGYYTRDFRASKTTVAADYLTLICLNGDIGGEIGKRQVQLCHEALRELVLETREFAQLLGDIRADGQRIQGSIEQRLKLIRIANEETFLRHITISAAQIADDNGRVTDAVLLYHLAEEYDNVISICNKALSDAIAVEVGDAPLRLEPLKPRDLRASTDPVLAATASLSLTAVEDPYQLTYNMRQLYESNALVFNRIKTLNREACTLLLGMAEAKNLVVGAHWAPALDALNGLNLLPIQAGGQIAAIRAHANAFTALPPVVARNIGNLLIWTITCCGNQRDVLRGGGGGDAGFEERNKERLAGDILQVAKDVMVFAGLIRYKLQPRVFEVLARVGGDVGAY